MKRPLLKFALALGLIFSSARAQDDTEAVGTFYDVKTHEYLTLSYPADQLRIGYSAGSKPFVYLNVVATEHPDEPGLRTVYTVSFPGSPQTKYRLEHWVNERAGIDCYDASGQLLNKYSYITYLVQPRPSLVSLLYGMTTRYAGDAGIVLKIDPADETYAIRLEANGIEHDLKVRAETLATNTIEFVNAEGHGPFVVRLFQGIRYRSPGVAPDRIELALPGGSKHELTSSSD